MQGLASYGSDSDEDVSRAVLRPTSTAAQSTSSQGQFNAAASTSSSSRLLTNEDSRSTHPAMKRVASTTQDSTRKPGASPLSGVRLGTPSKDSHQASSTAGSSTMPSPHKRPVRRQSSASPPRFERSEAAAGTLQSGNVRDNGDSSAGSLRIKGAASVRLDSLAEWGVPPLVEEPCNPAVEAKIANFHHLAVTRGLHFNDSLSSSKAFRNPRIYAKLVDFVEVDETGSNWSKSIWDPNNVGSCPTAARISELQRLHAEARQMGQMPGARSSIAFAPPSSASTLANKEDQQARIRDAMTRRDAVPSASSSSSVAGIRDRERDKAGHRDRNRERDRDRDKDRDKDRDRDRDRHRDRDRDRETGRERKKSRWGD